MAGERILLIEDDREIQSTISGVLQAAGYNVQIAPNGIEGQKRVEESRPDLIITDMMMPRMGGFPVLEFLKGLENAPPVIMITANEGGRHKAYAEMLGVAAYLRKPFAMDVLLEAISSALRKDRSSAGAADTGTEGGNPLRRAVRRKTTKKSPGEGEENE